MSVHYATYDSDQEQAKNCGIDPAGEQLTRDPLLVTCAWCKR